MLFVSVLFIVAVAAMGSRLKTADQLTQFGRKLGRFIIAFWVTYNIYYFLPGNFDFAVSLPLHVCDIVGIIAGMAMLKPNKLNRSVLYFVGLALTTQALITPAGRQDPLNARFWLYWGLHIGILCCAFFDLIVRRYRPTFSDWLVSNAVVLTYILIVLPLDIIFGWNYGYIGNSMPTTPSIINALGPWPWRIAAIIAISFLLQLFLLLPWQLFAMIRKTSGQKGSKNG